MKSWRVDIISRYGNASQLLATFNPDKQGVYSLQQERCLVGKAPSIARVAQTYGSNVATCWMELQVNNLIEFAGIERKRDNKQTEDIATVLMSNAPFLKLTEWMLFFHRFKSGEFGTLYGTIDGIKILEALSKFKAWRMAELTRIEAERMLRKKEEEGRLHKGISFNHYKFICRKARMRKAWQEAGVSLSPKRYFFSEPMMLFC